MLVQQISTEIRSAHLVLRLLSPLSKLEGPESLVGQDGKWDSSRGRVGLEDRDR
jgi:hypothetical protein